MFDIHDKIPKNPFDVLQVHGWFEYDADDLRINYVQAQRMLHPDRFKSREDKKRATSWSAAINEAYHILTTSILRAKALYEKRTRQPMPEVANDPEMLEFMMDLRESGADKIELYDLLSDCSADISDAFRSNNLDKVPYLIQKMIYLNRLIEGDN